MNIAQCSNHAGTMFYSQKDAEVVHVRKEQDSIHSLLLKFPAQFSVSGMESGRENTLKNGH